MLQIYHAARTRGYRVIWLCEELALPYCVERVDMSPAFRSSATWRRLNPVGKVPVMLDGDFAMFESGAMVQYILDRYGNGQLQPKAGTEEHARYLQWSWFAEATFARPIGEIVNHRREFAGHESSVAIEEMKTRATSCAAAVDMALQERPFLLGDAFSAADIMMGYTLRIYRALVTEALTPNLSRYWNAVTSRPAYRAAEAADNRVAAT